METQYLYEMHCHTAQSSRCARLPAEDMIRFYHEQGIDGVCITDHFLNPSSMGGEELPWPQRVELLFQGYELARQEGDKIGVQVFGGWEYTAERCADFLTYGLTKEWLIAHPEVATLSAAAYCELARAHGGLVIQAHPFREAEYIDMIRLLPWGVDGVETYNANNTDFENHMAELYADAYGLAKIGGSDNHRGSLPQLCVLSAGRRMATIQDLMLAIREQSCEIRRFAPR